MGKSIYLAGNSTGMTEEAKEIIETTGILYKGPMETPKGTGVKSINVTARKVWSTYANKRVFQTLPGVETVFSKAGININLTLFRENIEDTYGGIEHMQTHDVAQCRRLITRQGCLQIHKKAFEMAKQKNASRITCCHKANIMKLTDGMFLETFHEVAKSYPELKADDAIVDDLAMKMVTVPNTYDVIVLPNLQGDIISDLAAGLVGGLGMAPSANIGDDISIFEAVHGTAPLIAGKGLANPTALLMSGTMMLRHLKLYEHADVIDDALKKALAAGIRTGDLPQLQGKKPVSTMQFAEGIVQNLRKLPGETVYGGWEAPKKPAVNKMMVSPRKEAEHTVGMDFFVDSALPPFELAEKLKAHVPSNMKLVMISNRGTQVWPTGSTFTQCVNHYRCRVELQDLKNKVSESEVLQIASKIASSVRVCSLEMLLTKGGKRMYSLAQGQ
jgi:isocitrate dehydrogenase